MSALSCYTELCFICHGHVDIAAIIAAIVASVIIICAISIIIFGLAIICKSQTRIVGDYMSLNYM